MQTIGLRTSKGQQQASFIRRGVYAEDMVLSKLQRFGCNLETNEQLDHRQKLDFVITQLPENGAFFSCGVQVTRKLDASEKMLEFFDKNHSSRKTQRAIYLELEEVDLDDGGALTIFVAISQFMLNREYADARIIGIRVHEDTSYEYFELNKRIQELKAKEFETIANPRPVTAVTTPPPPLAVTASAAVATPAAAPTPKVTGTPVTSANAATRLQSAWKKEPLVGFISAFYPMGGHGFIVAQTGDTYFFHITNVDEDKLKDKLRPANRAHDDQPFAVENVTVLFEDAGKTRADAKYPEAKHVRIVPA